MSARRALVLIRFELKRAWGAVVMRVALLAMPVVLMVFLRRMFDFIVFAEGHLDRPGVSVGIPGLAVLFSFLALTFFGWTAFDEHAWQTWHRHRAGLAQPAEVLGAKLTVTWLHLLTQFAVLFAIGVLAFDLTAGGGSWSAVAVVSAVGATVASAYGFMLYVLTPTSAMFLIPCHIGGLAMAGLGGCLSPTSMMPSWIRAVAPATPTYWLMRGFRSSLLDGGGLSGVVRPSLIALAFAVAFASVGWWRFDPSATKRAFSE